MCKVCYPISCRKIPNMEVNPYQPICHLVSEDDDKIKEMDYS